MSIQRIALNVFRYSNLLNYMIINLFLMFLVKLKKMK